MSDLTLGSISNFGKRDILELKHFVSSVISKPISTTPYITEISRNMPTAFIFLIDCSGSMGNKLVLYDGNELSKAEAVANIVNKVLQELIGRSTKDYGIGDYIDISAISYFGEADDVCFSFEGALQDKAWVSLNELNDNMRLRTIKKQFKNRDGSIREVETPCSEWISAKALGRTPMRQAIMLGIELLKEWIDKHPDCYPPTVINITDGAATDVDNDDELLEVAKLLKSLRTSDGNVLMFNCHISTSSGEQVVFPKSIVELNSNRYAELLYYMSSELPQLYNNAIALEKKDDVSETYIAMAYNAGAESLVKLLNIGTLPSKP